MCHVKSGATFMIHWQTLPFGSWWDCSVCFWKREREEKRRMEKGPEGSFQDWGPRLGLAITMVIITFRREREKEVKDLRGRTFLHILPPPRYSHQISQRNALILTSCLWESLRQKLGLDWPLEQTNAALAQERVNTGQPQILKQTWRFIFPKPLKKTAAVPTNAHQSQRPS